MQWPNGNLGYLFDGQFHRTDGPAFVGRNGAQTWLQHGREHREDGPAVLSPNEADEYWVDGVRTVDR